MLPSDLLFKIVLIGDSGVGKSCLLVRFADDSFSDSYLTTIGVDFRFRTLPIEDNSVKLQIVSSTQWDTAGQERFRTITTAYYRGADGILLVFDKSNKESFDHIDTWMEEVNKHAHEHAVKMLVGNKADLEAAVTTEEAEEKARRHAVKYMETSAKEAYQVDSAFMEMARTLVEKRKETGVRFENKPQTVTLNESEQAKNTGCC